MWSVQKRLLNLYCIQIDLRCEQMHLRFIEMHDTLSSSIISIVTELFKVFGDLKTFEITNLKWLVEFCLDVKGETNCIW